MGRGLLPRAHSPQRSRGLPQRGGGGVVSLRRELAGRSDRSRPRIPSRERRSDTTPPPPLAGKAERSCPRASADEVAEEQTQVLQVDGLLDPRIRNALQEFARAR